MKKWGPQTTMDGRTHFHFCQISRWYLSHQSNKKLKCILMPLNIIWVNAHVESIPRQECTKFISSCISISLSIYKWNASDQIFQWHNKFSVGVVDRTEKRFRARAVQHFFIQIFLLLLLQLLLNNIWWRPHLQNLKFVCPT